MMTEPEAKALVANTLGAAFDRKAFAKLLGNMLKKVDPEKVGQWTGPHVKSPYQDHVCKYDRIGQYTDPNGDVIDLLVVRLQKAGAMIRARSALRGFVAHHLKMRDNKAAALVAFHFPDETAWRFSFVRMRHDLVEASDGFGVRRTFTPARRYSFLVGKEEKTHTAQRQLAGLLQSESPPTIKELEYAFSVEPVTKRFFEEYHGLYGRVRDAVKAALAENKKAKADFAEKGINPADFAKKLLGQIVFLYFLQRKGWLGVPPGKKWGSGDSEFLRSQFNCKQGANFYAEILQRIFYDALRLKRPPDDIYDSLNCRIPFLNGGLFTPLKNHDWEKCGITLSDDLFSNSKNDEGNGVLDVLDRYNFTVAEDEPAEREVAVDPEMLGKIFENLIGENERKGAGAFYTPRDTVHFMCRESLRQHILGAMEKISKSPSAADLNKFIHIADIAAEYEILRLKQGEPASDAVSIPKSVRNVAAELDELLCKVRVCDPAVGSGAFVVGMMHEIVRLRAALAPAIAENPECIPSAYDLKYNAIAECLYGADKDGGAVEIAQLRLWLSLVVDEESPDRIRPLPNLNYKLVCGDALTRVDRDVLNNSEFQELERLERDFFSEAEPCVKETLDANIFAILQKLVRNSGAFDLKFVFSAPFRENGGFDIVIGNPPYIRQAKIPVAERERLLEQYPAGAVKSSDYFVYFYLRGLQILRKDGIHAFVCSNSWLDVAYGAALQKCLLDDFDIMAVYHNEVEKEFQTADINTIVSVIRKRESRPDSPVRFVTFLAPLEKAVDNLELQREITRTRIQLITSGTREGKYIGDKWGGKFLRAPGIYHAVMKKCSKQMVRLGDIAEVRRGITSGAIEFFYVKNKTVTEWELEKRFLRPLLKTPSECKGYAIVPANLHHRIFMCRGDKMALKGTNALRYIEWAEKKSYHKRPTCQARDPRWWELENRKYADILVQKGVNDIFRALRNGVAYSGDRLYEIWPMEGIEADNLAVTLNCTISTLFAEVGARTGLGGGLLDIMGYELDNLPVANPDLLGDCVLPDRDILPLAKELEQPDRRAMDDAVFDALKLTKGEREDVRGETLEMVRKRLAKARAVPDNKQDEEE